MSAGGVTDRWPLVARAGELAGFATVFADPHGRGVLIFGPAGVGKTRLADEFLGMAAAAGYSCGRAAGSSTASEIPLGALAHLLPAAVGRERLDAVTLFTSVAREIRTRIPDRRFVLLADDVHLLDATSLTLVSQLVEAGTVFLIGTVRTGEPAALGVSTLWRDDRLARIDLSELSPPDVEDLLCAALRGPIEAGTVADVYSVGRGNALFVRELVRGALSAGTLRAEHGVWRLTGKLTSTAPLVDLVEARVRAVPAPGRRVLDLLALVGSTGPELSGADPAVLEELERAGLITVRVDRRRMEITLAHPLYGDVLCDLLPRLTRRRLLLEHADRIERLGARPDGASVREAVT